METLSRTSQLERENARLQQQVVELKARLESLVAGGTAARPSAEPVYRRLEELAVLEPDWDSFGAEPPAPQAIATMARLLAAVSDRVETMTGDRASPYEIMPIADGGLQAEWRNGERKVQLNVGPDSAISYLVVTGQGPNRRSKEGDDLPLEEAVRLVEQIVRGWVMSNSPQRWKSPTRTSSIEESPRTTCGVTGRSAPQPSC